MCLMGSTKRIFKHSSSKSCCFLFRIFDFTPFHFKSFLPEGQADETWEHSNKVMLCLLCCFAAVPYLSSSTCCSYQKDKWTKPRNLPKGDALSEIREHKIEKCFHLKSLSSTSAPPPHPRLTELHLLHIFKNVMSLSMTRS
jgi:hypothetical protein